MNDFCVDFLDIIKEILPEYRYRLYANPSSSDRCITIFKARPPFDADLWDRPFCAIYINSKTLLAKCSHIHYNIADPTFDIEDLLCDIISADKMQSSKVTWHTHISLEI